ncbi:MAG: CDP-glycerol glycerophosphotransferase family protein, partial [Lachnospiraceae bacterium]|nr:CDP-glycerol glycerophosphotransferase family protein [Lachnospiraceae bacterium]
NIYEYSLMRRPMLFFAFDEAAYAFSRGFHRPYREAAPGKVCADFEELMQAIEQKDFEFEKVEEYVDMQFDHFDSNARDRVIDWILLGKMPSDVAGAIAARDERMKRIQTTDFSAFAEEEVV